MEIPIESFRLKEIREDLGLTQAAFAKKLSINTTADIERGRTKLSGLITMQLLKDYHINPLWLFGESQQKYLNPNDGDVIPKTITVDNDGHENILLVNEKAAAGYAQNIGDREYYEELPAFSFPISEYRNASYRGFQIEGYSMAPAILPNDWVISKALSSIEEIKNGGIYVVVEDEGIRIKKLINNADNQTITLISINQDYTADTINYNQVKELWEFHSKLTQELVLQTQDVKLDAIHRDVQIIAEQLKGKGG